MTDTGTQLLGGAAGCRTGLLCSTAHALSLHAAASLGPAALTVVRVVAVGWLHGLLQISFRLLEEVKVIPHHPLP